MTRLIALCLFALVPCAAVAAVQGGQTLSVSATRVSFYSDLYVVGADGNVVVTLSDGTRLSGNTFAMDLKQNRFVLAGDVHLKTPSGQDIAGAAFAKFFDYDRAYFVPIIDKPDRWTYIGNDFAHPLAGRRMPGDTFFLHDLTDQHVFAYGTKALIAPHESVRFTPAMINLDFTNARPVYVPTPSYFLSFSTNPNFAQNGLAGATFDAPYPFAGGSHALATAHVRYDPVNRVYLAYEQHLVSDRSYVILSANPLTRPQKEYNLLALDRLAPRLQAQIFLQENTFQFGLSQPLSASAFAQFRVTTGLRQSFIELTGNQYWDSLLANPAPATFYKSPIQGAWIPYHPSDAQVTWTGFDHLIAHSLYVSLRSGLGVAHNSYIPEETLGGTPYPTIWRHFVGFTAYSPSLPLRNPPFRNWYVNAVLDKQRMWFSSPHHVDTTTTTLSLSRTFDRHLSGYASFTIVNTGDFYGARQSEAYPSHALHSPVTGLDYPGYAAFNGFATTRSLAETAVWTPSTALAAHLTWRENHDFPGPVPFLTSLPGYGPPPSDQGSDVGVSPQEFFGDLQLRVSNNLLIDLSRSYFFNYANRHWSPQFTVQLSR